MEVGPAARTGVGVGPAVRTGGGGTRAAAGSGVRGGDAGGEAAREAAREASREVATAERAEIFWPAEMQGLAKKSATSCLAEKAAATFWTSAWTPA